MREWLTQKTEEPKSNKGNFTFPTQTENVILGVLEIFASWDIFWPEGIETFCLLGY